MAQWDVTDCLQITDEASEADAQRLLDVVEHRGLRRAVELDRAAGPEDLSVVYAILQLIRRRGGEVGILILCFHL